MARFIDRTTGVAKLRPTQGDKRRHEHKEKDNTKIQMCLTCTKTSCNGNCKRIKEGRYEKS
jgi:hypothetical protein